ncbi:MAG: glycosyltransferase [Methylococcus sp.]|nr:MAG: glycosyltransferase [Methylococcus sp.]
MKIFYGVQGTGNGHITRARAIAPKLKEAGADVTWLFTGRPTSSFFDMGIFGDYLWRTGLTFETKQGHVQYLKTALKNNILQFINDIRTLDLSAYDLVVTDFEPVTAWAAKLQGIKTVGIGHQYAFGHDIPMDGADFMGIQVLKYFAPAHVGLGIHWDHFNGPILPPMIETTLPKVPKKTGKIIVYLPFEDVYEVIELLRPFNTHEFHLYNPGGAISENESPAHVSVKGLSREGFQADFAECSGVICNAGFELPSESLHFGKKLLVKPLHGQMEQLSNAMALKTLSLGDVMHDLDPEAIATWLEQDHSHTVRYPDVAGLVVEWLMRGDLAVHPSWIKEVWARCEHIN